MVGYLNIGFANLPLSVPVKKLLKLVNIWGSMDKSLASCFLTRGVVCAFNCSQRNLLRLS